MNRKAQKFSASITTKAVGHSPLDTMLKRAVFATISAIVLMLSGTAAMATPQPKGFIANHSGGKCWYQQAAQPYGRYFHSGTGTHYRLVFDNPTCMRGIGFDLDINKTSILNNIARNYSHADAKFMTRPGELRRTSELQVRGQCVQSSTYPLAAFVVEFEVDSNSIIAARHSIAVLGCKE